MRFISSVFGGLLEAIDRRAFQAIVERHDGDAYDKRFRSFDHLVTMVFAQLCPADGLRGLVESWNANANHHYHLGCGRLARSTLADANARRPPAIFAELFARLAGGLDRTTRREGEALVKLVDSTPIPLGKLHAFAKSNGRIRGMKVHVLYDPAADHPQILAITDANVNDAQIGRRIAIAPGATYVFDKGYCHYGWWSAIADAGSIFVTRPKRNMGLALVTSRDLEPRSIEERERDGFTVVSDEEVAFASKGDSKLAIPLRRLVIQPAEGKTLTVLTNDLARSAVAVAALYKSRWQIELLFRWIKQHLKIRRFLGRNPNAVRLQIYAAMIVFALLRLAARRHRVALPILRFTDLVTQGLFARRPLAALDKPPPINPNKRRDRTCRDQLGFAYA